MEDRKTLHCINLKLGIDVLFAGYCGVRLLQLRRGSHRGPCERSIEAHHCAEACTSAIAVTAIGSWRSG